MSFENLATSINDKICKVPVNVTTATGLGVDHPVIELVAARAVASIFDIMSKVMPYLSSTCSLISAFVPGSCLPNWLHGKARTYYGFEDINLQ